MVKRTQQMSTLFPSDFEIEFLTDRQRYVRQAYQKDKNIVLLGHAGTGKTFLACYIALLALKNHRVKNIKIFRSFVPGEDVGFLPGKIEEKGALFERPYEATINDLMGRGDAYQIMKQKGLVSFESTSHLRSMTFDDSFIIADEIQNMKFDQLDTIMTRVGEGCVVLFSGDDKHQRDINDTSFQKFLAILEKMREHFEFIHFTVDDVVRSGIVRDYIIHREQT